MAFGKKSHPSIHDHIPNFWTGVSGNIFYLPLGGWRMYNKAMIAYAQFSQEIV